MKRIAFVVSVLALAGCQTSNNESLNDCCIVQYTAPHTAVRAKECREMYGVKSIHYVPCVDGKRATRSEVCPTGAKFLKSNNPDKGTNREIYLKMKSFGCKV